MDSVTYQRGPEFARHSQKEETYVVWTLYRWFYRADCGPRHRSILIARATTMDRCRCDRDGRDRNPVGSYTHPPARFIAVNVVAQAGRTGFSLLSYGSNATTASGGSVI